MNGKRLVQTQLPLSPEQVNEFCTLNNEGANDILYEFDISTSELEANHILAYLSNLKIDFRIKGFDVRFFIEYLKTEHYVGNSNLSQMHAEYLLWKTHGELAFEDPTGMPIRVAPSIMYDSMDKEIYEQQMKVLGSLPLFLIESADVDGPIKERILGKEAEEKEDDPTRLEYVGPNFAHLMQYNTVLLRLLAHQLLDFKNQTYYTHYFDNYIYNNDKLIQFVIDNPNNLLCDAVQSVLNNA